LVLEFFRPNHGHQQINKEQQCDDADDGRFHFALLELLAKTHVKRAHDKKDNDDPDKNEVAHILRMSEILAAVLIKLCVKCVKKSLTPEEIDLLVYA
jgi:hypothetical protein